MVSGLTQKIEKLQAMAIIATERGDAELAAQLRAEIPSYQTALDMTRQKLAELQSECERTDNETEG